MPEVPEERDVIIRYERKIPVNANYKEIAEVLDMMPIWHFIGFWRIEVAQGLLLCDFVNSISKRIIPPEERTWDLEFSHPLSFNMYENVYVCKVSKEDKA